MAVPQRGPESVEGRRPELVEGPVEGAALSLPKGRRPFYGWIVLLTSFLVIFLVSGTRSTFGIFMKPLSDEFGWSRGSISLAVSLNTFVQGMSQPFIGRLVDNLGPKRIVVVGVGLMGMGMAGLALTQDIWYLYLLYGLATAIGVGAGGMVPQASLLARWFRRRRGLALALGTTGGSLGQLIIVPLVMALILSLGWRAAYAVQGIGLLVLALPLAALLIRNGPEEMGLAPDGEALSSPKDAILSSSKDDPAPAAGRRPERRPELVEGPVESRSPGAGASPTLALPETKPSLRQMVTTRTFLLLTSGFFICGFTVNLVLTHLAPFALEHDMGEMAGATALGLSGGASLVGVISAGALSDRYGRKNLLSIIYLIRGMGMLALVFSHGEVAFYAASLLVGVSWAVPGSLASALLADTFGVPSLGTLLGLLILGHQVVGALGAYLGGAVFDSLGSYFWTFFPTALATFVGAGLIFLIREKKAL